MPRTIRFHLDENCPRALAAGLRRRGVDVTTTPEAGLVAAADLAQTAHILAENRVIFTQDEDFLTLHASGIQHPGIVYCKKDTRSIGEIIRALVLVWEVYEPRRWPDASNSSEALRAITQGSSYPCLVVADGQGRARRGHLEARRSIGEVDRDTDACHVCEGQPFLPGLAAYGVVGSDRHPRPSAWTVTNPRPDRSNPVAYRKLSSASARGAPVTRFNDDGDAWIASKTNSAPR